jgi:hypothetical protein
LARGKPLALTDSQLGNVLCGASMLPASQRYAYLAMIADVLEVIRDPCDHDVCLAIHLALKRFANGNYQQDGDEAA